jgi:hypothetical protein
MLKIPIGVHNVTDLSSNHNVLIQYPKSQPQSNQSSPPIKPTESSALLFSFPYPINHKENKTVSVSHHIQARGKDSWEANGSLLLLFCFFLFHYSIPILFTRGEEGALPKECHSLTFFCNSGGYLPYIFL